MTNTMRVYALETTFEFLKQFRRPAYAIATLGIPLMFYAFFGLLSGLHNQGVGLSTYLLATYGTFGVVGASLFGFGVSVALERGAGWLPDKPGGLSRMTIVGVDQDAPSLARNSRTRSTSTSLATKASPMLRARMKVRRPASAFLSCAMCCIRRPAW